MMYYWLAIRHKSSKDYKPPQWYHQCAHGRWETVFQLSYIVKMLFSPANRSNYANEWRDDETINTFLNHWSIDGKKTKPRTFQVARHHEYQQHSHHKYGRQGRNDNIHKIKRERATRPLENENKERKPKTGKKKKEAKPQTRGGRERNLPRIIYNKRK